jgi:hypothetical protein
MTDEKKKYQTQVLLLDSRTDVFGKQAVGKRKRKYFSFSVFHAIPVKTLEHWRTNVTLPSAVDYKSMIGGYRTLLVMNSLPPIHFAFVFFFFSVIP